ncbi:unnamed protein product [Diatraea saccharalis]|uniref:Uncharacterized protein n=1 Tax=Diatraea saccharalis TaxID=40085 RepID=A0A9N9WI25_9NEOP|nr:unnamed protein product [Diatraea saccharalis]
MRGPRARFPAARLRGALLVLGGSDGLAELDSVDALEAGGGAWRARKRLPGARVHAAAAGAGPGQGEGQGEGEGALYVVGGWAAGHHLRRVDRYSPDTDEWTEAPPLITGHYMIHSLSIQSVTFLIFQVERSPALEFLLKLFSTDGLSI